jgi:hypothetical protein
VQSAGTDPPGAANISHGEAERDYDTAGTGGEGYTVTRDELRARNDTPLAVTLDVRFGFQACLTVAEGAVSVRGPGTRIASRAFKAAMALPALFASLKAKHPFTTWRMNRTTKFGQS